MDYIKVSKIICPECGHQKDEEMSEHSCQFFYECTNCKSIITPFSGDCCVFCSYGDVPCPSVQMSAKCCN